MVESLAMMATGPATRLLIFSWSTVERGISGP